MSDDLKGALGALACDLGDIAHTSEAAVLAEKSRDYYWFSPILKQELDGLTAELVVTPGSQEEVLRVASLCARHRIPITARGAGTGNFGQAVPLAGGVVLDMTAVKRMLWVGGEGRRAAARAEAGILVADFDAAARSTGWELRMHPSTKRMATLGGFMAGGHAGIGSVNYGILRDRGNILGIKLATIEESPRVLEIRGDNLATVHHAYGVNGIMLEIEMPLAPAYRWRDVIVTFADFMQAVRFGWALATADGILKKLVSPITWKLARHFHALRQAIPDGHHVVLGMVAEDSLEALADLVRESGGNLSFNHAEGAFDQRPIYEFAWGHTTLQVLKDDASVTYLICIFRGSDPLEQVRMIHERFGEEAPLHLELKRINGQMAVEGIPVIRYTGPEQIERLAHGFEDLGVKIANPHTYFLQNGGMHRIDAAQIDFKRASDPHGLMNPGKIAGHDQIEGAPGGSGHLRASGWAY
jgi:FAD/FMN-containing dehydrogenase